MSAAETTASGRSWAAAAVAAVLAALAAGACSHKASQADGGSMVGACLSDKDCRAQGRLCDPATRACVQCLAPADCGTSADCVSGACVPFETCQSSLMCGTGKVCDLARSRCVACVASTDCDAMSMCVNNECRSTCVSDKDCVAMHKLCDFSTGTCVACVRSTDCPTGQNCNGGVCTAAACTAGATSCAGNMLFTCDAAGTAWGSPVTCPFECRTFVSASLCVEGSPDGGGGEGGAGGSGSGSGGNGGATGSGGSGSGTGGAGGGGTGAGGTGGVIVNGPCGDVVDDMEDADGYICRGNGRIGQWYTVGDMATPAATLHPIPVSAVVPARDGSDWAVRVQAPMYYGPTTILGVDLQYDGLTTYGRYDASQYQGITFWIRGTGVDFGVDVWVACAATTPIQYGGTCPSVVCYDNAVRIGVAAAWSQIMIPFSSLTGGFAPFSKADLTHIQFRIATSTIGQSPLSPLDLWVDDLGFYR